MPLLVGIKPIKTDCEVHNSTSHIFREKPSITIVSLTLPLNSSIYISCVAVTRLLWAFFLHYSKYHSRSPREMHFFTQIIFFRINDLLSYTFPTVALLTIKNPFLCTNKQDKWDLRSYCLVRLYPDFLVFKIRASLKLGFLFRFFIRENLLIIYNYQIRFTM